MLICFSQIGVIIWVIRGVVWREVVGVIRIINSFKRSTSVKSVLEFSFFNDYRSGYSIRQRFVEVNSFN